MSRIRLILCALFVAGLSFGIAACGSSSDSSSTSATGGGSASGTTSLDLKIGGLFPQTGDLSDFGPSGAKAAQVAVDEINKVDPSVTLTTEDDQTSDQAGVSAARKLVADGTSCIDGAYASSVSIPVARSVSIREGVLQISPASTSDEITGLEDNGLMNRTAPPDSFQGPALADAIAKDLGDPNGKVVNIGARNDSYGTGLVDTFTGAWESLGGTVGQTVVYDPEAASYDAEATKIVSGSPDAIAIFDFPETFAKVGPALARTGDYDPSITWGTDGLASSSLPKTVGADTVEGFRGTAPGTPKGTDTAAAFDKLYTSSDPTDVARNTFDTQTFDAAILCYLAAVAADSTDGQAMADQVRDVSGPPGAKFTYEQLGDAVTALQNGDDIDYEGVSGPINMDENGDATAGVYDVYEYKGGKLNIVDQVPLGG
jgi:ABC-type branched-subunit amino acid transport system substrate-binding protein